METKYISSESLKNWLSAIRKDGKQILAPVEKNGKVDFKQIDNLEEISMSHVQTVQSTKAVAFPRAEVLFSYKKGKTDVELTDFDAKSIPETVVFGLHPCDAAAFIPLSAIFNWDTKDKPFNEHQVRTALISVACAQHDDYCFCTSVNGGPGSTSGSDILLTPVQKGYIVEVITEKGKALIDKYAGCFEAAKDLNKEEYLTKVPVRFSAEELEGKLSNMFESQVWKQQSERCLGCGACAFVCPTCACFDIQEDAKGSSGSRIRCWDSCGFSLFTLHTSGHNPRQVQSQRWRQRLLHKFSYMPQRLSVRGCTGCGRCSRACPVDMNISEHLASIEKLG
jgi:ferredoxin